MPAVLALVRGAIRLVSGDIILIHVRVTVQSHPLYSAEATLILS